MKKLATLLLTAGLVFAGVSGASAIDFKAKGQYIMSFDYGSGATGFSERGGTEVYGWGGSDSFQATQRIRLQIDAVASESLSGTVFFELGNTVWGDGPTGGALGADGRIVEVKHAYIDWIVPNTELKVRMGLQALGLPSYCTGTSQVFVDDVAAIVLNNKFNDNVSLTAFWARPYNDNYNNEPGLFGDDDNFLDNVDMFGLSLPMNFTNVNITPWVMYTAVGRNFNNVVDGTFTTQPNMVAAGLLPTVISGTFSQNDMYSYGSVWHAGLTGQVKFDNPFTLAWDLNYGNADFGPEELSRDGFYGSILAEYKMDWGTPGLYFWYSTGDDDDASNGSERLPTISTIGGNNEFSQFALNDSRYIAREGVIGTSNIGTWGIGARIKNVSFMEDLTHTFSINYFQGTNAPEMGELISAAGGLWNGNNNGNGMYLTTNDWALEFAVHNKYKIYDNLTLMVEAAYIILDFDEDTWGNNYTATDAWNINTSFVYSF